MNSSELALDAEQQALTAAAQRMRRILDDAARGLVEREVLAGLVALSAVAREHLLVVGPPGAAKSIAVRQVAERPSGRGRTRRSPPAGWP